MTTMSVKADSAYLAMPDAVNVNLLPAGYPAYLGYGDGEFPTAPALSHLFPDAELVILTVTGRSEAHGVRVKPGTDVEPGDVQASDAVFWVAHTLTIAPGARPVIYASVIGQPGYGMPDVLSYLARNHIDRGRVRLLSAHYGLGPHVCGPVTCRAISTDMDGTQWTDSYPVPGGVVDMSLLKPDFFGTTPSAPSRTERLVRELGIVRQGDTGAAVKTVQGLYNARVAGQPVTPLAIDGVFGPATAQAVRGLQRLAVNTGDKITVDGIVGPATWPVLLGVA